MQCHIQEITPCIAVDPTGTYLLGGTKGGRIFCWEISSGNLKFSWQAHFKTITSLKITKSSHFCISGSDDGMVRVWDMQSIMSHFHNDGSGKSNINRSIAPYRYSILLHILIQTCILMYIAM
jgi:WD40 repeat protein